MSVAPCAGAWVEIIYFSFQPGRPAVAPCAGAWVEIFRWAQGHLSASSPPVRGHGLKSRGAYSSSPLSAVAPCAGAWVEITRWNWLASGMRSPPVRGRGLTFRLILSTCYHRRSPPVRGRGLKYLIFCLFFRSLLVAPCAGAWVEICSRIRGKTLTRCRPLCGGVG